MAPLLSLQEEMDLLPQRVGCGELPAQCRRPLLLNFLELCCQLCVDSVCFLGAELLRVAQEVWELQFCEPAVLAAAVVLLQGSRLAGLQSLKDLVQSELTWSHIAGGGRLPQLGPFPFAAEFLVLYQNFVPVVASPCEQRSEDLEGLRVACNTADGFLGGAWTSNCSQEARLDRAVLLPRADVAKAGCLTSADDETLALRCRSRRFDSLHLAPTRAPPRTEEAWQCPAASGVLNKYSEQSFRSCAAGFGSWGRRIESHLKCVAVQVAETLQLRPGESVLDWGSGCGWTLTWMSSFYGVRGYGIEATSQNIAWARRFSQGEYCLYGGFDLGWVPEASFDAVISYWVLYHHNSTTQCDVIRQLLRKLKPHGRAWFGGNIPSPAINIQSERFRRRDWLRCLLSPARVGDLAVSLDFIPDAAFFRRARDVGKMPGDYLYFQPTYSVLVRRI